MLPSRPLKKWVAPAGCDFEVEDFSRILVAPGRCDPLFARNLPFSTGSLPSRARRDTICSRAVTAQHSRHPSAPRLPRHCASPTWRTSDESELYCSRSGIAEIVRWPSEAVDLQSPVPTASEGHRTKPQIPTVRSIRPKSRSEYGVSERPLTDRFLRQRRPPIVRHSINPDYSYEP